MSFGDFASCTLHEASHGQWSISSASQFLWSAWGCGTWPTVPHHCSTRLASPSLTMRNIKLPESLLPGSICLAGIDSCGNKANGPGWGEEESVRIKKKKMLGSIVLCYIKELTGLLISTAKHRGIHYANIWKPLVGPTLQILLHGRHGALRSDVCCSCSNLPILFVTHSTSHSCHQTKALPVFLRDCQADESPRGV